VIGGLVARVEVPLHGDGKEGTLYVQSLALLSPYRGLGLAGRMLEDIVQAVIEHNNALEDGKEGCGEERRNANGSPDRGTAKITSLYAHVWTENSDALEWYRARGFMVDGGVIDGYYRKLNPDTALVMRRHLGVSDHLRNRTSLATSANSIPPPPTVSAAAENGNNDDKTTPSRPPPNKNTADPMAHSFMSAKRADSEWNDLPEDILTPKPAPRSGQPSRSPSRNPSASSSRVNLNLLNLASPAEPETRNGASSSDTLAPPPAMGSGPPSRTATPGGALADASGSGGESGESSRSSSAQGVGVGLARKKTAKGKRAYPAAAFSVVGNGNGNGHGHGHGHAADGGPPK
jgi:hypothetical protein